MRLDIVKAHREQIFSQIQDGLIAKETICELFDALIKDLSAHTQFVCFNPSLTYDNVVDLGEWKVKKDRHRLDFPKSTGDNDDNIPS